MEAQQRLPKLLKSVIENNHVEIFKFLSDFMGFNYSVMTPDGEFIVRNETFLKEFPVLNIDTGKHLWDDCVLVMNRKERVIKEEEYNGKFYLSVKQPLIEHDICFGIMVVSFDITDKKLAEIAKNQFIKSINHDIRTPLMGAMSLVESLHKNEKDENKINKMTMIYRCLDQLKDYLISSLEVASNGKIESKKESFLIADALNQVIVSLIPAIKTKGLRIRDNSSLVKIFFYKKEFKAILLNLITNAIKYTNQGGYIFISAWYSSADIKQLEICVEDTGIGIDEKNLPHIFENFYRVTPSELETQYNGAGMGLYIVSEIVKRLNGTIEVTSELGKGTSFKIKFTLQD